MKYGEHLKANIAPEYGAEVYLQYEKLDQTISQLAKVKPSRYAWWKMHRNPCKYYLNY
jgi:hypothetical protein